MKPYRVLLEHILESILLIEKYTTDIEEEAFLEDLQLQDSVYRRLEIIGEAVKNLPADYRRGTVKCLGSGSQDFAMSLSISTSASTPSLRGRSWMKISPP